MILPSQRFHTPGGVMKRSIGVIVALALSVCTAGCAASRAITAQDLKIEFSSPAKRILLIGPDVELSELTAGGLEEVRADWTAAAADFIVKDISAHFAATGTELIAANKPSTPHEVQLVKLQGAIGSSILDHAYGNGMRLESKKKRLDWTLGPGANEFRQRYGADYALFVAVHDSYTSTGRAALIATAALFGVPIRSGQQFGLASLVDLRTGNVIWFNQLSTRHGDLRTEAEAQRSVSELLKDIPL